MGLECLFWPLVFVMEGRMKVLFVDVDGPLIPATALLMDRGASFKRKIPELQVRILNEICARTGACVVMNTTHNRNFVGLPDICDAMAAYGFKYEFFHNDCKTTYPVWNKRSDSVRQWLASNPGVDDYVCIDDVICAVDGHMILVDPYIGLTLRHANEIIARWGGDELIFMC